MLRLVMIANPGIYVAMAAATRAFTWDAEELLSWGGNLGALSLHGQPWRLLVGTYFHAGPQHIFANLILLGITGAYVEPRIGSWTSLIVHTVCGLAGSAPSAHHGPAPPVRCGIHPPGGLHRLGHHVHQQRAAA